MRNNIYLNSKDVIIKGIESLYRVVSSTYGPNGNTVIINNGTDIIVTKDGATVAKSINSEDPIENIGVELIKESCIKANSISGDGSTTTVILTYNLIKNLYENAYKHLNKEELQECLNKILGLLDKYSNKVEDSNTIYNLALVSTNNDTQISSLIKKAFSTHLSETNVILESSTTGNTYLEKVEGFSIPIIPTSKLFSDRTGQSFKERKKYKVNIIKNKVFSLEDLKPYLKDLSVPQLFIVHDIEENVITSLVNNVLASRINVNVLKYPIINEYKRELLGDFESILSDKEIECIIDEEKLIVCNVNKGKEYEDRLEKLALTIQECTDIGIKSKLIQRQSNLRGSLYKMYIGGETESIVKEAMDRAEDALNAVKSAIVTGYNLGGGTTLNTIAEELELENDNPSIVYKSFTDTLKVPYEILNKENRKDWKEYIESNNIYDSTFTLKNALTSAVSTAILVLNTNNCIVNNTSIW